MPWCLSGKTAFSFRVQLAADTKKAAVSRLKIQVIVIDHLEPENVADSDGMPHIFRIEIIFVT